MQLLLTYEGHEVRTASDASEALQMLDVFRPELILTGIQMPGMDGFEMARRIKSKPGTGNIAIVALTTLDSDSGRDRALAAGCDGCIPKPIDTATLATRVREILERRTKTGSPDPQTFPGLMLTGPEIESLRRRFLNEGTERSLQLLEALGSQFDPLDAAKQAREWTGNAAVLGYPQISSLASNVHQLVAERPLQPSEIRESLSNLILMFSEMREAVTVPLPKHVAKALTGKHVALIGFTPEHADRICAALERVNARPLLFDAAEDPESDSVRQCDLIVVHVRSATWDCGWLDPAEDRHAAANLVLTGERADLLNLPVWVRTRVAEYIVDAWQPEEVLMRLYLALPAGDGARPLPGPVLVAKAATLVVPPETRQPISRPNIVVADDDPIILTVVVSLLKNYGMNCLPADNGQDALRLIREENPQAAVLDVNMPGLDGFEVLAGVRAANLPVQIVLLTACQKENDILRAFDLGADDYLVKPFNPFELVARLKRLLRK
ncbi:MAG: response regulator [Acidobacteriia bacterium]|nr:response regulator [Terriglobia bacterium]